MIGGGDRAFADEMRLDEAGEGRFVGKLTGGFNAPVQPQGGVTAALGVVAAERVLGRPDQRLRSLSTTFAGQVPAGPTEVLVEVIREGRGGSQVRSTVRPDDGSSPGHVVTASFVQDRAVGIDFTDTDPPECGPPQDYADRWALEAPDHPDMVGPRPPFFEHFEVRMVSGHVPWDPPWEPTASDVVTWMRWNDTPVNADGGPSELALLPPIDTMPPAVFERAGPDEDRFLLVPSVDLYVQVFDADLGPDGWMLRRNRSRWAGAGLAAADMELFASDGRPLAFATQLMYLRPVDRDEIRRRIESES